LNSASYSKQKCNLKKEVENFLVLLDLLKNFSTATPEDIRKFLIFKEKNGKRLRSLSNLDNPHALQNLKSISLATVQLEHDI
jgi:hypothetical protein